MPAGHSGETLCTSFPSGQSLKSSDDACGVSSCTVTNPTRPPSAVSNVSDPGSGSSSAIYFSSSLVLLVVIEYVACSSMYKTSAVKAATAGATPDVEQAMANSLHSTATADTAISTATPTATAAATGDAK